ncbi:hypothetical protein WR25_02559 [Diploscapter pachys]|uniref:Large ribosomal subunit protein bL9m n=1 Tax=Diploscapter pachys TaxID=2018661 RepID=A0A2A2KUC7_9BILA|nr:hypothetical protein WR25_02559 [Diploscapter pachys]
MLGKAVLRTSARQLGLQQSKRTTYILQQVFQPAPTPEGKGQRPPTDLHSLQKYAEVEYETDNEPPPVKIILLEDIEGVGNQFEVVEVKAELARNDLILSKRASYASPFDIKYYGAMKERMKDELEARVRIPYEYKQVARQLVQMVIPINVNMDNKWKLNKHIFLTSLRKEGIEISSTDAIFLPPEVSAIAGPNFELEAKLLRFYLVIEKAYIVPMLGRLSHISIDESKQILAPQLTKLPSRVDLAKHGLFPEEPVYSKNAEFDASYPVVDLMQRKRLEAAQT